MDRPEWVAANPIMAEAYVSLTNNKNRGKKPNAGGDATPVGGPNPRKGNVYGQILRWRPDSGDHSAKGFAWDLFVMAGNPTGEKDYELQGAFRMGLGTNFYLTEDLALDFFGEWVTGTGSFSDVNYGKLALGLQYNFGSD